MLVIAVFIISFLCFFGITIIIPTLPPGDLIQVFLNTPEIISPTPMISGMVFTNGLINGLFWGIIILIIFSVATNFSKKKTLLPPGAMAYPILEKSTSEYIPPKTFVKKSSYNVRKRKTQVSLDQNIEKIEGIGYTYGYKLRKSGINTINDLLKAGNSRKKRHYLAKKIGVSDATILRWVNRADFFRINGIGKQYSSLLEETGVNSVTDLARRNPRSLYEKVKEKNWEKSLVKRTPPYKKVKDWIESAKSLQRIVVY